VALLTDSDGEQHEAREALRRARADFLEMPGLQITAWQAARLWACDQRVCDDVLATLVRARFLIEVGGRFVRADGRA
jgi:hypothetical protein